MRFRFTVDVTVERVTGLFASRDEIEDQIRDALTDADPSSLTGDNGGDYEITDWIVEGGDDPLAKR